MVRTEALYQLPESVIVLDNSKYHKGVVEIIPKKSSRKTELIQYLKKHDIILLPPVIKSRTLPSHQGM